MTLAFKKDPIKLLTRTFADYGGAVRLPLLGMPMVAINHPDDIKRVLQDNHSNYDKDAALFRLVDPLLGDGLVTVIGGASWMSRRRLIQPSFHRRRISQMTEVMTAHIADMLARWDDYAEAGTPVNIGNEMSQLTLRIVARTLFGIDIGHGTGHPYSHAVKLMMKELAAFLQFPLLPLRVPTPGHRRFWKNIAVMDAFVYEMIHNYRLGRAEDQGDMLHMLIHAQDAETGESMNDHQLRDEITSFLFAGHETSATALTWTLHTLSRYPDIESRLRDELGQSLGERMPTATDLPNLAYLPTVLNESLRVNPPIWQLMRHAREDDILAGCHIPAGSNIFWTPYLVHRNPEFWPNPEKFDPDRFASGMSMIHKGAFIPFSSGPRICIGNIFALTEMQLILASVLQRYRFRSLSTEPIQAIPQVSLRPDKPIFFALERRE